MSKQTDEQMEKAFLEPETVFGSLENVLQAPGYTRDEKIEVLRRWEYRATEEAVALEEGMPGDETDLLSRRVTGHSE